MVNMVNTDIFFGLPYAAIWTVIQLMLCSDQKKEYAKKKVPLWQREDLVELNRKQGIELTENYNGRVYISDDHYIFQYPKGHIIKRSE